MATLSALQRTFFVVQPTRLSNGNNVLDIKKIPKDSTLTVGLNWSAIVQMYDTTISSSEWTITGNTASLSSASSGDITSQVNVNGSSVGTAILRNKVTLANGLVHIHYVQIETIDLELDVTSTTFTGTTAIVDHGNLTGLTDDDHTQYLKVDGTRAMTGDLNMGSNAITSVGNVDGRDVSADGTKLDTIETNADVTDETNVTDALDGATLTDLGTPASGDLVLLQDASDSNNLKVAQFSEFGGGGGGAPTSSQYVTLATDATLTNERVLTAGEGIDLTDGGAGSTITVSGEDATSANKGIASFDATDFTVTSGDVTVNAERIQDIAGGMWTGNTETGITITYQDIDGTIDAVVSDTTVAGDSGSTGITPGDTLTIAGGTNATTAMSGDILTVNVDDAFLLNTGDTGTGTYDFGGAVLEIPNGTGVSTVADGQIGLDTLVTDYANGYIKYYSSKVFGIVAIPNTGLASPTDGYAVRYNATSDEFELADIDHDALTNYVANEHIDWTSTSSNFSTTGTAAAGVTTVTSLNITANSNQLVLDSDAGAGVTTTITDSATAARVLTLPDATDTLVGKATTDTLTNKTINTASNTITVVEADISDLQSYLLNVVEDTTPQLGGSLDVNGNKIVSVTNGDIDIEPNGTGNVLLGNFTFDADQTVGAGQDNYVLTYDNGTGLISLEAATGGGLGNIVEDTTPQLGGQLDVNGNAIGDGTRELLTFTEDASAVNHVNIENEATGSGPIIRAAGDDANIDLNIQPKATGNVTVSDGTDTTKKISFEVSGATTSTATTLTASQTANRTVTLPDATDTLVGKATTDTFTNKTFDANGTGNSLSNVDVADLANGTDGELITWSAAGTPTTVAVGTSGHVLTSNGAGAAPTFQAASGGGDWVKISTATASTSATIEFTGLSSTYQVYALFINNLEPATDDADLYLRTDSDGGASFDSAASHYRWGFRGHGSNTTTQASGDNSDSQIILTANAAGEGISNASDEGLSGVLYIYNPADVEYTTVTFDGFYNQADTNEVNRVVSGGARKSAAAVDAIQLLMDSGNITSGEFILYGLKA